METSSTEAEPWSVGHKSILFPLIFFNSPIPKLGYPQPLGPTPFSMGWNPSI